MMFMKSEHTIKQAVTFSFPVSTAHIRSAWDHDPIFGDKERLAFYDLGFPMEARIIIEIFSKHLINKIHLTNIYTPQNMKLDLLKKAPRGTIKHLQVCTERETAEK